MTGRPCACDRFLAGRAYRAGRDCVLCWLYVHRPEVRSAWGGDPADCAALLVGRPDMAAAELADLLDGPPLAMPEGWRHWTVTRAAHQMLAERAIARMPAYPEGRYRGRGAVICGGGAYEASAYVTCRMLRQVGWRHPIQVWHRGADEPVSGRLRRLAGVEVVDAEAHPARAARRLLGGWEGKSLAVLHCPFEEVLFLDADCYPVADPEACFEPENNPHGIVTWPDTPVADEAVHWPSYGTAPDGAAGLNGGHYVFDKRRAWRVLQLAAHYDNHSDYYYWRSVIGVAVGAFSDQEQVRAALHKLGVAHHRYTRRPLACAFESYVQAGPHGQPLFVHRFANKFGLPGLFACPPRWHGGILPMEATAWRYFLEWLIEPDGSSERPDEVPGWFSRAECELWARVCEGRDVLELGRHHGRSTAAAARTARRVVSLDRASAAEADLWLQRYGVRHKVWLREGEFAELVGTSGGPFSACLIDGAHDRASVEADIGAVLPHLRRGAMVGFHDYGDPAFPDVRAAADAAAARHGWTLQERADMLGVFVLGGNGDRSGEATAQG